MNLSGVGVGVAPTLKLQLEHMILHFIALALVIETSRPQPEVARIEQSLPDVGVDIRDCESNSAGKRTFEDNRALS